MLHSATFASRPHATRRRSLRRCATQSAGEELALPSSSSEQAALALEAVKRACAAGVTRQSVEFVMRPTAATDLDDWPGGQPQRFRALEPLVSNLLRGLGGGVPSQRVIEEGDAVVSFVSLTHTAVTFPTAETLRALKDLDASNRSFLFIVNPAWSTAASSNFISDFGVGPWRTANEAFVAKFVETFSLRESRIRGQEVRVLRCFPSDYTVFALLAPGQTQVLGSFPERPTFAQLDALVTGLGAASIANASVADRLRAELIFNKESAAPPPPQ